ncbi:MAG: hypothetical protein AAF514_01615, partial [Verrucomicrobiota bacterium]
LYSIFQDPMGAYFSRAPMTDAILGVLILRAFNVFFPIIVLGLFMLARSKTSGQSTFPVYFLGTCFTMSVMLCLEAADRIFVQKGKALSPEIWWML